MSTFNPLEEAERLGTRLLDAIHETRTVLRDLKTTVAEARTLQRELHGRVAEIVDTEISEEVRKGLENYEESLNKAIESADAAVHRRFDTLTNILLGEDGKSKREGKPSLVELAEKRKQHGN